MSHTYHFLCVDCREVFDVGKLVELTEDLERIPISFAGWRDQETGEWISGGNLWRALERWHILHRGHEVRLISEPFLDRVDPEGQFAYVDDVGSIFRRELVPDVDDEADADRMPADLFDRLRTHQK